MKICRSLFKPAMLSLILLSNGLLFNSVRANSIRIFSLSADQWARPIAGEMIPQLEPVKKVARMLKKHLNELLNWCDHHITNAVSEGLNSRIQAIKSAARGFHSFDSYRSRILFFCGKLNLTP